MQICRYCQGAGVVLCALSGGLWRRGGESGVAGAGLGVCVLEPAADRHGHHSVCPGGRIVGPLADGAAINHSLPVWPVRSVRDCGQ